MNAELISRITTDLGYFQPKSVDTTVYHDQLKYGAMSEWIRAITQDVDPLIGSNRVGVTREYLEDRAADVLMDLAQAVDGVSPDEDSAKELVHWMVNQMLRIGELWIPHEGLLLTLPVQVVSYRGRHARIAGLREPSGPAVAQIGLCHYSKTEEEPSVIQAFESARMKSEKHLIRVCPGLGSKLGRLPQQCLEELKREYKTVPCQGGYMVSAALSDLPEYLDLFLVQNAWPASLDPLDWVHCHQWFIPSF